MTVKELIKVLSDYPEDMEVTISEGISMNITSCDLMADPYWDYNLLVLIYKDDE